MQIHLRSLAPPPFRIGAPPLPVVALGLALAGQLTVTGRTMPWIGLLLLAGGGAAIAVAALRAPRMTAAPATSTLGPPTPAEIVEDRPNEGLLGGVPGLLALLLVTVVAGAFRLPYLDRLPPGLAPEEAALGLDAVRVLAGGWTASAWSGWPIFHVLTIGSVAALGQTPQAVRLPDALAGVLFAPALFLLGRQLGGTRLGAVAGLLGAVAFWHADLTRGAWGYGAWGITCETLGLALLARTVRRPSPGLTALAGLLLGLALQASWGALAAIGAGAALALEAPSGAKLPGRRLRTVLGPFLVYFAVAAGPVLLGVSVPDRAPAPMLAVPATAALSSLPTDLLGRAGRLLLLFNVAGDPSPLHGLRGEPMLDPITGTLLVLGTILALVRWRDQRERILLCWLLAALAVALLASRSPQPSTIIAAHALTPALLLSAGALISATGSLTRRRPGSVTWQLDLTLTVLAIVVGINGHALFIRRPADTATWTAYASAEAMAAHEINGLAPGTTVYLADVWIDHPTIRFLAPDLGVPRRLDPATTLPLLQDEAFAYYSPGSQDVVTDDLERVYEDGDFDRYRSPLDDTNVVMRSFRASAKDVAQPRGVTLRATIAGLPRPGRYTLQDFALSWPVLGEPVRAATLDLFGAVSVAAPGVYRLRLTAPPGTTLEVNGVTVALVDNEAAVTLARGSQRLHVLATVDGAADFDLRWMPPGGSTFVPIPRNRLFREQRDAIGLLALYRPGTDPAAPAELTQVERYLQRDSNPPPLSRPYVADWIGILDAPKTGTYRFKLDASGPASLWIDDRPVLIGGSGGDAPASFVLAEGDHRMQVRLIDSAGPTRLDLSWAPPGDDMDPIPTSRLLPPDAPVDAVVPFAVSPDTAFVPLGTPRVRWLATTSGEPRAVAVQADGDVFVANVGSRQVEQVVGQGQALVGLPVGLSVPSDVEVGPDGSVWALDALTGDIVRLGQDGAVNRSLDTRDLGLYRPRGLGIAPDGTILIADTGGSRIVRLTSEGARIDTIGPAVGGPERIRQPTDVAVGPDGQIFVVNGEGGALLRLSSEGQYERHWLVLPADTERGSHLAIGPDRSVWVSEPEGRRVSRFTFDGTPSGVVDPTPAGRLLRVPVGIAVGPDGTLYVADASLRAIVALSFER